jgi:hypothetical protein
MEELLRPVLAQIEAALGPVYREMGLELDVRLEEQWEDELVVSFRSGETTFFPFMLYFTISDPRETPFSLTDAEGVRKYYDYIEVSADGWHKFVMCGSDHLKLKDTGDEILADIRRWLGTYRVVEDDDTQPFVLKSAHMAMAHDLVTEFCEPEDLIVERDMANQVERYLFLSEAGRTVTIEYEFGRDVDPAVFCDGEKLGTFLPYRNSTLEALLEEACEVSHSLYR